MSMKPLSPKQRRDLKICICHLPDCEECSPGNFEEGEYVGPEDWDLKETFEEGHGDGIGLHGETCTCSGCLFGDD